MTDKPLERVLADLIAKPHVREIIEEYDAIIEQLGAIDPAQGSAEIVACVLLAIHRRDMGKVPFDWWQPTGKE